MSKEQLKAFLEKVKGDTSLQEKLKAAADADAVVAIAKEAGFSISTNDLMKAESVELSHKELEFVSGGNFVRALSNGVHCSGTTTGDGLSEKTGRMDWDFSKEPNLKTPD